MRRTRPQKLIVGTTLLLGAAQACAGDTSSLEIDEANVTAIAEQTLDTSAKAREFGGDAWQDDLSRVYFSGGPARELLALSRVAPHRSEQRRSVRYVQSEFALCAESSRSLSCVSLLTLRAESDRHFFTFGGSGSDISSRKAMALDAAMEAAGFVAANGEREGRHFTCKQEGDATSCGLLKPDSRTHLTAHFDHLPELGQDFVYEGWAIVDGAPVSTGRFELSGTSGDVEFELAANQIQAAAFVLTIEPRVGDLPGPSEVHLMGGGFLAGRAELSSAHAAALGADLGSVSGQFILAAPTAPMAPQTQGVWFVNPATGTPSLNLPTLPPSFVYEGWVVTENGPVSTGKFAVPSGSDSDGAGPAAGTDVAPPFPGQDFINPPLDLATATIVVSVEPVPDTGAGPFDIKPLIGMSTGTVHSLTMLDLHTETLPRGSVRLTQTLRSRSTDLVAIANRGSNFVSLADAETGIPVGQLELRARAEPMYIQHLSQRHQILVGDRRNQEIAVFDDATLVPVKQITASDMGLAGVFHMFLAADAEKLFVSSDIDRSIAVVDLKTLSFERSIELPADLLAAGGKPHDVVCSSAGRDIFVSFVGVSGGSDAIVRIDTRTGRELARISVEIDPHVSLSNDGRRLFAPVQEGNAIYVLDANRLSIVRRIESAGAHGASMTLDGTAFLSTNISGGGDGGVVEVNLSTHETRRFDVPYAVPHNLVSSASNRLVFVSHSGGSSDRVSILERQANNLVATRHLNVGLNPFGIALIRRAN